MSVISTGALELSLLGSFRKGRLMRTKLDSVSFARTSLITENVRGVGTHPLGISIVKSDVKLFGGSDESSEGSSTWI